MRNAPEVVREVGVDDVPVTPKQHFPHLANRLLGTAARAVGLLLGWKVGLEDGLQHHHGGCHADP